MSKHGNEIKNVKQRRLYFLFFPPRGKHSDVTTNNASASGFDDLSLLTNRAR